MHAGGTRVTGIRNAGATGIVAIRILRTPCRAVVTVLARAGLLRPSSIGASAALVSPVIATAALTRETGPATTFRVDGDVVTLSGNDMIILKDEPAVLHANPWTHRL
jgi:hypothetical protein